MPCYEPSSKYLLKICSNELTKLDLGFFLPLYPSAIDARLDHIILFLRNSRESRLGAILHSESFVPPVNDKEQEPNIDRCASAILACTTFWSCPNKEVASGKAD